MKKLWNKFVSVGTRVYLCVNIYLCVLVCVSASSSYFFTVLFIRMSVRACLLHMNMFYALLNMYISMLFVPMCTSIQKYLKIRSGVYVWECIPV